MRAAAVLLAVAGSVPAPPAGDDPIVVASCGRVPVIPPPPTQVAATTTAPPPLPVHGDLRLRWSVRVSTTDPRVADVTAMEFNAHFGLLAVTREASWVSLASPDGSPAGLRSIGVAAMRGAAGTPTSLATFNDDRTFVVFGGEHPMLARYALGACGMASKAVPINHAVLGGSAITQNVYAFSYPTLQGRIVSERNVPIHIPDPSGGGVLGRGPSRPGRVLAASNPVLTGSVLIIARRLRDRGPTIVELADTSTRDGPASARSPYRALAILARAPAAMATSYAAASGELTIVLAFPGPRLGAIDLYALDGYVRL